jgi:transposase
MSALPISMRKIKEVLRLKFDAGLSQHQIAAALKISPGVVNKYLKAANAADITWPLPDGLSETQLRRKLFPPGATPQPTFPQPDFATIHRNSSVRASHDSCSGKSTPRPTPTITTLTQFCFYYQQWSLRLKFSMRQPNLAGEKIFVDYAGPTVGFGKAAGPFRHLHLGSP